MSWKRFCKTNISVLIKTSSEDLWLGQIYLSWSSVLKTSSKEEDKRRLQDVLIKTNVCWDKNIFTWFFYQHCLMVMLENLKESRGRWEEFGAFFADLSKEFNCTDHNLLISKLSWYGVIPKSFHIYFFYLSNQKQGVRKNNSYSGKSGINYGVPQCFVLGLFLFNIDLIDLFLECQDYNMNSYADDITPYSCTQDISSVISELRKIDQNIFD